MMAVALAACSAVTVPVVAVWSWAERRRRWAR